MFAVSLKPRYQELPLGAELIALAPLNVVTEPMIAFPLSGRVVVRDWSVQPSLVVEPFEEALG